MSSILRRHGLRSAAGPARIIRSPEQRRDWLLRRGAPAAGAFGLASVLDQATGQQHSSVLGSGAILVSTVFLVPRVRSGLAAAAKLVAVWGIFIAVRSFADSAGIGLVPSTAVASFERTIFGGRQASAWLQDFLRGNLAGDVVVVALTIVYATFFIAPIVSGMMSIRADPSTFRDHLIVTVLTLAAGAVFFLLMPTAPPWMTDASDVERVTQSLVGRGDKSGWSFEPNPNAAFPSIHVSATVLVALVATRRGWIRGDLALLYPVAMSVAVVALGEHFVIDALIGFALPLAFWRLVARSAAR